MTTHDGHQLSRHRSAAIRRPDAASSRRRTPLWHVIGNLARGCALGVLITLGGLLLSVTSHR